MLKRRGKIAEQVLFRPVLGAQTAHGGKLKEAGSGRSSSTRCTRMRGRDKPLRAKKDVVDNAVVMVDMATLKLSDQV